MPRFVATRRGARLEIVFDDGGMNLLSSDALEELREVVDETGGAGEDTGAPTVFVFRSGRPGLFAAGADMAEMRDFSPAEAEAFSRAGQSLFDAIEKLPLVTVALIDGDCFGGALDLALSFDFRLATPRSRFAHPGARLGIVTGFGGTTRWHKVMGRPAAHQLFIANRVMSAEDARDAGIIDEVSPDFEDRLRSLEGADGRVTRMVKDLTRCSRALSRSQLLLMGRRLGTLYFDPES